jgi:hypothetical protein
VKSNLTGQTPQRTLDVKAAEEVTAKPRGLEDLDVLGEALMKQNLPTSAKHQSSFQKSVERVPLNELARKKAHNEGNSIKENQTPNILVRMSKYFYSNGHYGNFSYEFDLRYLIQDLQMKKSWLLQVSPALTFQWSLIY